MARTGVSEEILARWIKDKLVRPAGFTDDRLPLFSEETVARLQNILRLQELGYGLDEIQKIMKKIGLPGTRQKPAGKSDLDQYLTVGNLAEMAGVSPRTIKHWEDKGIIEPDMRSEGGFRLYSKGYVHLCKLIQDLQLFGYTLEEIKAISDYFRDFLAFQERLEAFDNGRRGGQARGHARRRPGPGRQNEALPGRHGTLGRPDEKEKKGNPQPQGQEPEEAGDVRRRLE